VRLRHAHALVTKAPDALRDAKEVGKAIAFELAPPPDFTQLMG
jgi:hypothetical protein